MPPTHSADSTGSAGSASFTRVRPRPGRWANFTSAVALVGAVACGVGGDGSSDAPKVLEMPVQSEALPTSPLDPKAFVRDPCAFASAAAMASFLPFIESELAQTREELSGRGRCIYRAKRPETTIDILFGPTKPLRANEELRNIKGVAGVKVRALAEVAEVSIPFPAAAIPDAPAADRVKLRVELHPGRTRGRARPKGPPPDPDALEKVALGMARNLIERLDIES